MLVLLRNEALILLLSEYRKETTHQSRSFFMHK
nr:MAG TPA: hypothetical protein [Caudoviricetes sp.]